MDLFRQNKKRNIWLKKDTTSKKWTTKPIFKCVCTGKECDWVTADTAGQMSCVVGCNAHVRENGTGKTYTSKTGKVKEETWMDARYSIRCPGSNGFENWYVFNFLLSLKLGCQNYS